jgi:hypothetical protein
LDDL